MRTHREPGPAEGRRNRAKETMPLKKWIAALGLVAAPALCPAVCPAAPPAPADAAAAAATANQQLADAVAENLRAASVSGTGVMIDVQGGVCRLSGEVATAKMKDLADWAAAQVEGVTEVENVLTVAAVAPVIAAGGPMEVLPTIDPAYNGTMGDGMIEPVAATAPAAAAPAGESNQAVVQRIAAAVQASGLSGYDMEIRFKDGACTLDGEVADSGQIAAAVAAAKGVNGVGMVANNLTVLPPAPVRTAAAPAAAAGTPESLTRQQVAMRRAMMQRQAYLTGQIPPGAMPRARGMVRPASQALPAPGCPPAANPAAPAALGAGAVYNQANLPNYAWPGYAQHPNYAAVTYPKDYSASAWPYIGPFYPYPQVPLGWREVELEWDDGQWYLDFHDRTDRWWWFMNPENW